MPKPGDILFVKNFQFEDGSKKDKLFVVLNLSDFDNPCIVLKTTSQSKRYPSSVKGCNKNLKCFFAPISWQACFKCDTYIQLPQIIEFSATKLIEVSFAGMMEIQSSLTADCLAQLKSCLAGFKEDILDSHWALIYK